MVVIYLQVSLIVECEDDAKLLECTIYAQALSQTSELKEDHLPGPLAAYVFDLKN